MSLWKFYITSSRPDIIRVMPDKLDRTVGNLSLIMCRCTQINVKCLIRQTRAINADFDIYMMIK